VKYLSSEVNREVPEPTSIPRQFPTQNAFLQICGTLAKDRFESEVSPKPCEHLFPSRFDAREQRTGAVVLSRCQKTTQAKMVSELSEVLDSPVRRLGCRRS
jgi:hypothetical protein